MSEMSKRLLDTLNAVTARDDVAQEAMEKVQSQMRPGIDYDEDTGEWMGDAPEGYKPIPEPPSVEEVANKESKVPDFDRSDASTDYKRVRDTTYALQEATLFMIGQTAKLAVSTEAPRAFSVFRELVDTMRGLNKDLMDNQKTFKAVTQGEQPPEDTTVDVTTSPDGTTTVSVGKSPRSSRDLLKTIEEARKRADARARGEVIDAEVTEVVDEPETPVVADQAEEQENGVSEA